MREEMDGTLRSLQRIAQFLGLPLDRPTSLQGIARFLDFPPDDPAASEGADDRGAEVEQTIELLMLFQRVDDPQARNRCLSFVRHAAHTAV